MMLRSILAILIALCAFAPNAVGQEEVATVLTGKLELPDGSPAVGAQVSLMGWAANNSRQQKYGLPKGWKDPDPVTVGEDGLFRVSVVPHRAYQFVLDADLGAYPGERWRWSELVAGEAMDLGTVRFQEPCFLVGHIEDQNGEIQAGGWRVNASSSEPLAENRSAARARAVPDPETGEFRIGPLPPGKVRLSTRSDVGARAEELTVRAAPGEPARVVLQYVGPELSSRIVFSTYSSPYYVFDLEGQWTMPGEVAPDSNLVLLGPDGEVLQHARHVAGTSQDWEFTGVGTAESVVELRDPRFEVHRFENVVPGKKYRVNLVGSAALELEVLDEGGAAVEAYGLWVGYRNTNWTPNEFEVRREGTPAPKGGLIKGVVPGDVLLEVRGPGGAKLRHTVGPLEAGETRKVRVQFQSYGPISGRVLGPDGAPLEGIEVEYTRGRYAGQSNGHNTMVGTTEGTVQIPGIDGAVTSGAGGAFTVHDLDGEAWTFRALASPHAWAISTLEGTDRENGITLQLPRIGTVRAAFTFPAGTETSAIRILPKPVDESRFELFLSPFHSEPMGLSDGGEVVLEGLPVGPTELLFQMRKVSEGGGSSRSTFHTARLDVAPGEQDFEFDLGAVLPAACRVSVAAQGQPLGGVRVVFTDEEYLGNSREDGQRGPAYGQSGTTDAKGVASVGALTTGRQFLLTLSNDEERWVFAAPRPAPFAGSEAREMRVELDFVERELRVLGPSGAAAANRAIQWASNGMTSDACQASTSAAGTLTLRMPVGEYSLFDGDQPDGEGAAFDWKGGDGPVVVTLP